MDDYGGMKNSTTINFILTLFTKLIVLVGSFIVSVILARVLGPDGKGLVTSILVVPQLIISLGELGIRQSSAYFVGRKVFETKEVVSSLFFLWLVTSLLSLLIVYVFYWLNYSIYDWKVLLIAGLIIPVNLVINYSQGVLQGIEKYRLINSFEIYKIVINLLLVLILVWAFDLGVIGAIIVNFLIGLIVAVYSLKIISKETTIRFDKNYLISKSLFIKGISFGMALFILQLNYKLDILILGYFEDSINIGIYSVGTNLAELIWQVPAAAGLILFGKSANSKSEIEAVTRSVKLLRMIFPFLILFCIVFSLLSPIIVKLLYGSDFAESSTIIVMLLPGVLFMVIVKLLHSDLAGRGFPLYALWITIGPLILNVILNFILIPKYSIYGSAGATTISYAISGLLFLIVYSRREKVNIKSIILIQKEDVVYLYSMFEKIKGKINR